VIAILQCSALAYGVYSIAESRPVFITFVKDRFELVRAGELDDADLAQAAYGFGPLVVRLPARAACEDPRPRSSGAAHAHIGGKDIHIIPRYYVDYAVVAPRRPGAPRRSPGCARSTRIAFLRSTRWSRAQAPSRAWGSCRCVPASAT
jgi:hypothetical protein